MLYPTRSDSAADEIIAARPPFANGGQPAYVIVRPVRMMALSILVADNTQDRRTARQRFPGFQVRGIRFDQFQPFGSDRGLETVKR
jgi:hypothetical protein